MNLSPKRVDASAKQGFSFFPIEADTIEAVADAGTIEGVAIEAGSEAGIEAGSEAGIEAGFFDPQGSGRRTFRTTFWTTLATLAPRS